MPKIYSDLPAPVMQALLAETGFESCAEKDADIKIYSKHLPPAPYRLGEIIDLIKNGSSKLAIKGLEFDLAGKTAKNNASGISLTEKEAEIIRFLSCAAKPVSREELLERIWQYAGHATTNTVETHIYRLRQKLTENFGIEVIDTIGGNYSIKNEK